MGVGGRCYEKGAKGMRDGMKFLSEQLLTGLDHQMDMVFLHKRYGKILA